MTEATNDLQTSTIESFDEQLLEPDNPLLLLIKFRTSRDILQSVLVELPKGYSRVKLVAALQSDASFINELSLHCLRRASQTEGAFFHLSIDLIRISVTLPLLLESNRVEQVNSSAFINKEDLVHTYSSPHAEVIVSYVTVKAEFFTVKSQHRALRKKIFNTMYESVLKKNIGDTEILVLLHRNGKINYPDLQYDSLLEAYVAEVNTIGNHLEPKLTKPNTVESYPSMDIEEQTTSSLKVSSIPTTNTSNSVAWKTSPAEMPIAVQAFPNVPTQYPVMTTRAPVVTPQVIPPASRPIYTNEVTPVMSATNMAVPVQMNPPMDLPPMGHWYKKSKTATAKNKTQRRQGKMSKTQTIYSNANNANP